MYRRIDDFVSGWKREVEKTQGVLDAIPTEKMGQAVANDHRTLARMAWHLVETCVELPSHLGLTISGPKVGPDGFIGEPIPADMAAIRAQYAASSASIGAEVAKWKDAELEKVDEMYGEKWTRGFSLTCLVVHQAHHRGQMTVLMRQAGLTPPAIYGPTKEGWPAYGMKPPVV